MKLSTFRNGLMGLPVMFTLILMGCAPGSKTVDVGFSGQLLNAQNKPLANQEIQIKLAPDFAMSDFEKSLGPLKKNRGEALVMKTDQDGKFKGSTYFIQHVSCFLFALSSCGPDEAPVPTLQISVKGTNSQNYVAVFQNEKFDFRKQISAEKFIVPQNKFELTGSLKRTSDRKIDFVLNFMPIENDL